MAHIENSSESVPIPALLVEPAMPLAGPDAASAPAHTPVVAVSARPGTIVACAFALTLPLLVAWPALALRVSLVNGLAGLVASMLLSMAARGGLRLAARGGLPSAGRCGLEFGAGVSS